MKQWIYKELVHFQKFIFIQKYKLKKWHLPRKLYQFIISIWGIFTIRVPLFHHKTQGFCFCYLPNTKSKWNKFKWKILDNSNYDNFRQLMLLKTRFFLSIHIAHKVSPQNKVHKELNFLRLLGSHLLKKHCSMLRAFQVQPGLVQKGHC
jgi:hypothetical protein